MTEIVTLELPETLAQQAKEIAALSVGVSLCDSTYRSLEAVLLEWIDCAITEQPVESLPDRQVLALCDLQMENDRQEAISDLLVRHRR
ncbi:MAG: hypothetical protein KME17_17030 [Cyanosarcina radialis HA8281-LM2]|jgi:hypothetical protein|nr:hypothetical protein [Cyanosarcina radialis HA8281-LM2]